MDRDPKVDSADHQPSKAELEENVSVDATPEALARAVTRGGAERRSGIIDSVRSAQAARRESVHAVLRRQFMLEGVGANDCISLEDKLLYGNPVRQVEVADFVSDTALDRFIRGHEGSLLE